MDLPETGPMMEISDLSFSYAGTERAVFHGFTLTLTDHTAILGPSGCGKTTLLRLLAGLSRPSGGRISPPPGQLKVAMVFQEPRLLPWRTVLQNVELVLPSGNRGLCEEWLARLGLADCAHTLPSRLSGGMRQRVALARAMVTEPSILLVDEPLTGLDRVQSGEIADLLVTTLRESDALVVLVTHDLDLAVGLAERVIVLSGSPAKPTLDLNRRDLPPDRIRERILSALGGGAG